tara:strand:- start:217 stop:396 length:180 start_codon:yes stop_codon:yes gene_type:complete
MAARDNFSFELKDMKHTGQGNSTISPDCSSTVSAVKGMTSNPVSIREQSNIYHMGDHRD